MSQHKGTKMTDIVTLLGIINPETGFDYSTPLSVKDSARCNSCYFKQINGESKDDHCYMFKKAMPNCSQWKKGN